MSKVIVIGIDGLDPLLIKQWIDFLPYFKKFKEIDSIFVNQSTFPPDSICAWTSIFTGKNPAEHGLLESIDYLSKNEHKYSARPDFKGQTFWDLAGRLGKKVCIINPFLAYPAWEVNGIMISGPVFESGNISACPQKFLSKFNFPPLGGIVDFPDENELQNFINNTKKNTQELAKVSLEVLKYISPDLFFVTFLTLDRIQHFLWRFTDSQDPTYPGENFYKNSIKEFYILFDQIIGEFMQIMDKDTLLVVISDHGHGRRCTKCLNLNEFLRRKGYLAIRGSGIKGSGKKMIEKMKILSLKGFHRFGLQDLMYKITKFIPNRKSLRKSLYLINKETSLAYTSEFCSTNPFGGIEIKKGNEYEELRSQIMEEIEGLNGYLQKNIVKWIKRREELYEGEYLDNYPDVVFELDEDYGVNWNLFTSLISENYTHRKVSGGHRKEAILAIWPKIEKDIKIPTSVIGIKNFILGLLRDEDSLGK